MLLWLGVHQPHSNWLLASCLSLGLGVGLDLGFGIGRVQPECGPLRPCTGAVKTAVYTVHGFVHGPCTTCGTWAVYTAVFTAQGLYTATHGQ